MSIGRRGGASEYIVISGGAGNPSVLAGTADPSAGAGVAAAEGSLYLRYVGGAGELWFKTGAADTAWTSAGGGGASSLGFFGNEVDGDVTLGADADEYEGHYGDLDLNGWNAKFERLMVRGTLTVPNGSVLHQDGEDAVGATGGTGKTEAVTGMAGDGGDEGVGGSNSSNSTGFGGDGGAGGAGTDGAGAAGGTSGFGAGVIEPNKLPEVALGLTHGRFIGSDYTYIDGGAGGGGGTGDAGGGTNGGGGGAGGSILVVCARHIVIEAGGAIRANGGAGADGSGAGAGGGGGGGGGVICLFYETITNNGTLEAAGGSAGLGGGGAGVDGTDGDPGAIYQVTSAE